MENKAVHDLAVAYAHAKLVHYQQTNPKENGLESEIRTLLKAYNYALCQIPIEESTLDEHF